MACVSAPSAAALAAVVCCAAALVCCFTAVFYNNISRTSAVSSTNFGSIFLRSCVAALLCCFTVVLMRSCVAVLLFGAVLYCCTVVLLRSCVGTLLRCCALVLLRCDAAALVYCCSVALLRSCVAALFLCCCALVVLCCCVAFDFDGRVHPFRTALPMWGQTWNHNRITLGVCKCCTAVFRSICRWGCVQTPAANRYDAASRAGICCTCVHLQLLQWAPQFKSTQDKMVRNSTPLELLVRFW